MTTPKRNIRVLFGLLILSLVWPYLAAAFEPLGSAGGVIMIDPGHNLNLNQDTAGPGAISGLTLVPGNALGLAGRNLMPTQLTPQDYLDIYMEAETLLRPGVEFRTDHLQVLSADTIEQALQNYSDFNAGELFYAFCSDYDQLELQGNCPSGYRDAMFAALEKFAVLARAEPAGLLLEIPGQSEPVAAAELGRQRVLEAAREIANFHLIYGNEFMVDALDYRFSSGAVPNADQILTTELDLLDQARQQFALAMQVLVYAFNTPLADEGVSLSAIAGGYLGDYFTGAEFETFGLASGRMVMALDEASLRYRLLGNDAQALAIYDQAFTDQYFQALAIATKAAELGIDFYENGGWDMLSNLGRLREQAQAIQGGLNPFGYNAEYVPLQSYAELRNFVLSDLLPDAVSDEKLAREATREFDRNEGELISELSNLQTNYGNALFDLCGADAERCDGGLMRQNDLSLGGAQDNINLAYFRAQSILEQIAIEQERSGTIMATIQETGDRVNANILAGGIIRACRETQSMVDTETAEFHRGQAFSVDVYAKAYIKAEASANPLENEATVGGETGFEVHLTGTDSYNHAWAQTSQKELVYDPAEAELARLDGLNAIQQAMAEAKIEGANSQAAIRNLLLQQTEQAFEIANATTEWNKLAAEHTQLSQQYKRLYNQLAQAETSLATSYLANPAYRILKETQTVEAGRSINLAAHFAYFTAKAAEYELLLPYPDLNKIYKARTADDIRNFMNNLEAWRIGLIDQAAALNRFPYTLSIAKDILGLTDEAIDPDGQMNQAEIDQVRYERFQAFVQQNTFTNTFLFPFTTRLPDLGPTAQNSNNPFSRNIWNNRLAGVGQPLAANEGVAINLVTRQSDNIGTPEILLTHGGGAAYRAADRSDVIYTPRPARLVGFPVPPGFTNKDTTAAIFSSVNGNGAGTSSSALLNLSVAAAAWKLKIDLNSGPNANLDLSRLEDIEIRLDSTGYALQNQSREAVLDSLKLQADFDGLERQLDKVNVDDLVEKSSFPPEFFAHRRQLRPANSFERPSCGPVYDTPQIPDHPLLPRNQEAAQPALATTPVISGAYFGTVAISSPVSLGVTDFALALGQNETQLYGNTLDVADTLSYSGTKSLSGSFEGTTFSISSEVFETLSNGKVVQRQFTISGRPEAGGNRLQGLYTEVIHGLTPKPLLVTGKFLASRPLLVAPASVQTGLAVFASPPTVQPHGSATISASLFDGDGQPVAGRQVIFTADLGSIWPVEGTTDSDGVATTTFTAGDAEGTATITAVGDGLTAETTIFISNDNPLPQQIYLPITLSQPSGP